MPYLFDLDTYSHFKLKETLERKLNEDAQTVMQPIAFVKHLLILQHSILSARIDDSGADIQMTWVYLPKGQKA